MCRCRLCTSAASWRTMAKKASAGGMAAGAAVAATSSTSSSTATSSPSSLPSSLPSTTSTTTSTKPECPPDVEELGRSTWTLLHSLTAAYPTRATTEQQTEMRSFLGLFSKLYPCWVCADDFRSWIADPSGQNQPRLSSRAEFGQWMCDAHNAVNRKLGKKEFDCNLWEERWRTGWKDGRCE
jgi:mitochondrial FAD-linked sulfhydryl oxidase